MILDVFANIREKYFKYYFFYFFNIKNFDNCKLLTIYVLRAYNVSLLLLFYVWKLMRNFEFAVCGSGGYIHCMNFHTHVYKKQEGVAELPTKN